MKKLFLTISLIFLSFIIVGNNTILTNKLAGGKEIYKHFGNATFPKNHNTTTAIEAYITREYINNTNQKGLVSYKFQYEIIFISHSTEDGISTNTNLYGVRIYYNGVESSNKTFPNGFSVLIKQEPTMIYWIETNDTSPDIIIKWGEASYQSLKKY